MLYLKNTIKRMHFIAGALALSLVFSACDKNFEELNTNPNAILRVTPDLLLPTIIRSSVNQVMGDGWGIGNIVIQQTAKIQFVNTDRYIWGDQSGTWNGLYTVLRDVNNLEQLSETAGQNNYRGISLVMKSWIYSVLTDAYGDVPYSQAIQGKSDQRFTPAYDPQEQIYAGIIADLEEANNLLGSTEEVIVGDILYAGNISRWKKLANALHLRYLMRISGRQNVSAQIRGILGDAAKYPIFESNEDNGTLRYLPELPNQFPVHTYRVGSFDEFRLSKTLGDKLAAYGDPRVQVFARPTAASAGSANPQYAGVPNGLDDVAALNYNGGVQNISRIGNLYFEGAISERGLNVARGYIMAYPELQFILAEAAAKGLISGSAKAYYESGVSAAFEMVDTNMPAGYLMQEGVAFQDAQSLERIGTQKWIGLFFTGLEAWFDWRRTGYPALQAGPSNQNNNRIPVRFAYPLSEQSLNAQSRAAAVARQGTDDINTAVWWDN
ncbi:SusD/RagB family nutrient-binding outer membrane lipoprotein [Sphingobacterium deserti]|uniref:SusD/RagB family nutrient-binding outer membrane lipoprotein n=1 Tax=Sphingobacterium deserti TaxID=1229276 RepID=A0A0B8T979_9SPHI|nr:SusD/RagB family nutrient-binding outer membrane lipoprotein [Sphingobacterium deserti]KGE14555.1 hypothetical protein DI53_1584 [Sphingobacterium deserti]